MRVIITGASGFIGRHLMQHYSRQKAVKLKGWVRSPKRLETEFSQEINILEYNEVESAIELFKPDIIFHCVGNANVSNSFSNPTDDMESNYISTHNILFALKEKKLYDTCFVLCSSAAVYGNPKRLPIKENDDIQLLSPYALHKHAAEECCCYMRKNYDMNIKIARIFSAYGPGLKKQIFWDMYCKAKNTKKLNMWGTGAESRDYIFIDDLVKALVLIAEKSTRSVDTFNIGSGTETTIRKVAEIFSELIGLDKGNISFNGIVREGDPVNWQADISRLKELEFQQKITLSDGIKKYINWAEKNVEL